MQRFTYSKVTAATETVQVITSQETSLPWSPSPSHLHLCALTLDVDLAEDIALGFLSSLPRMMLPAALFPDLVCLCSTNLSSGTGTEEDCVDDSFFHWKTNYI